MRTRQTLILMMPKVKVKIAPIFLGRLSLSDQTTLSGSSMTGENVSHRPHGFQVADHLLNTSEMK